MCYGVLYVMAYAVMLFQGRVSVGVYVAYMYICKYIYVLLSYCHIYSMDTLLRYSITPYSRTSITTYNTRLKGEEV